LGDDRFIMSPTTTEQVARRLQLVRHKHSWIDFTIVEYDRQIRELP